MTPRHVVAIAVTDAIPVFEFAVPCEVFGIDRSDLVDPWYELRLCAAEPGPLRTSGGLRIETPYGLDDLLAADTVLVPACRRAIQRESPPALLDVLRRAHARGARMVSICSGAYLLAAAGLLDGRRATTHWMNAADFAHRFPAVKVDPTVLYVDEGDVLTSAGTGSAIDLCLHLVRLDHGAAVANEVARRMVVPPHRDGGQAQFARPLARGEAHDDLAPLLEWARERLDQPLTVARLAEQARMSPRTLARRFRDTLGTSPLRWLLEQRVRLAQELLETTDEPVELIARRTGFGTAVSLRQHFRRVTSVSPQTYRHVFRRARQP
ncbi:helix-turn-helix domain-containing protein [Micromonospora sp. HM5-17]|uniref:helix-turn-helix domain-containing protein n=1 Tax=Micromonospora sp. HM5-17 TaxID=2487710 RepID=UPI000F48FF75|nr:helix-turn-helix domain-containing protein [Micromonospora sp. HM5-17]ROT31703.1 helix-turn-helix domain-containing protein [Micromonospora sp. HM5-17]